MSYKANASSLATFADYTPTFTAQSGNSVSITVQSSATGYIRWAPLQGAGKVAIFSGHFQLTIGSGSNPTYVVMSLPFTAATGWSNSQAFPISTYIGSNKIGLAYINSTSDRNHMTIIPDFSGGSNWNANSSTNYFGVQGLYQID